MDKKRLLSLYQLKSEKKSLSNNNDFKKERNILDSKINHFKYLKLYNISKTKENSLKEEKEKKKEKIRLKDQQKYEMLKKIFQKPKKIELKTLNKLTKAKLPFSSRKKEEPEIKQKRIKSLKPNPKFHDFYTIKWLRHKYSNSLIEKSINTLLPDNGKPVIPDDESEEDRKHRELKEFLDSSKPVIEKEKNVNINPKYFFDTETFEKVLKLKEIFLEFDEDGSRKMEIDEMFTMFNQNNIFADISELVNLFFKNKKTKKKDIMNLYLDFFQFMQFSLHRDQDFRNFMRDIKHKYQTGIFKSASSKDENTYLPMSFNLILDYFIIKGKERSAVDIINKSIKDMDDLIYKGLKKDKNLLNLNLSLLTDQNRRKSLNNSENRILHRLSSLRANKHRLSINFRPTANLNNENISDEKENNKYIQQMEKVNFKEPIKEFEKLFKALGVNISKKSNKLNLTNSNYDKKIGKVFNSTHNSIISENSLSYGKPITENILPNNKNIMNINEDSISRNISENTESKNIDNSENNSMITDIVNNYLNRKFIKKLNKSNYNKFHNIKIAIDKSNKEIDSIRKLFKNKKEKNNNKTSYNDNNYYSKDNSDYSDNLFYRKKTIEKNVFNFNNLPRKKLNPFIQYSSYFKTKNKIKMNKYPSNNKNKEFMINDYFMKNSGNKIEINDTYNSFNKANISKIKLNSINKTEKSVNKVKYDYIPIELLK